jgi:hypothetical protein
MQCPQAVARSQKYQHTPSDDRVGGSTRTLKFATTVKEGLEGVFEVAGLRVASKVSRPKSQTAVRGFRGAGILVPKTTT